MRLQILSALIAPVFTNINKVPFSWEAESTAQKQKECDKFRDTSGTFVAETPYLCKDTRVRFKNAKQLSLLAIEQNDCWCDHYSVSHWWDSNEDEMNDLDIACNELYKNYNEITSNDSSCHPSTLDVSTGEYVVPISALSPLKSVDEVCFEFNEFKDTIHIK